MSKIKSQLLKILDYEIDADKYVENCISSNEKYKNEYFVLSGTSVVIKSKQWISPANGSFLTYNFMHSK